MILIKNRQRKVPININHLREDIQKILEVLDYAEYDIALIITTDQAIRKYNKQYRHIDKATDILSFSFHDLLVPGKRIVPLHDDEKNLGDLIVSAAYIARAAEKENVSFSEHFLLLLIHGICHLLGYDHVEDADWRKMCRKEAYIKKRIDILRV